jgi:hypothetical protein
MNRFASAVFQSKQDFRRSQWIIQIHNGIFLCVAALTVWLGIGTALPAFLAIAAGFCIVPILVWIRLSPESARTANLEKGSNIQWNEGYSIVANTLATVILITLERFSIPNLLGEEKLATFAVLAAISGSPFKILQTGVRYTLLPRLRAAVNKGEIKSILARESIISGFGVFVACLAILLVTPLIIELFFAEKYSLGTGLIIAALFGGTGQVLSSFSTVITTSLGVKQDLQILNYWSWISLAVGVIGAIAGSSFGLTGLVFGVSLGWYVYFLVGIVLSLKYIAD